MMVTFQVEDSHAFFKIISKFYLNCIKKEENNRLHRGSRAPDVCGARSRPVSLGSRLPEADLQRAVGDFLAIFVHDDKVRRTAHSAIETAHNHL